MNLLDRKIKFIRKAMSIHWFKYTYDKVKYRNAHTDIIITCPVHGDFTQSPKNHIQGSECPICSYKYIRYGNKPYTTPKIIAYDICRYRNKYVKCYF